MRDPERARRWSIYFVFLLAIVAVLVLFASSWLADTAKELADSRKREKGTPADDAPADGPALQAGAPAKGEPDRGSPLPANAPAKDEERSPPSTGKPKTFPPIDVWRPQDAEAHQSLVEAMRGFLDLRADIWRSRTALEKVLTDAAGDGRFPLKDMQLLKWLVAQGRSFAPSPFTAPRRDTLLARRGPFGKELRSGSLHMHLREPDAAGVSLDGFPRAGPWPLLVALHGAAEARQEGGPGRAWLERHWPTDGHPALYRDWFVLIPISKDGSYSSAGRAAPAAHGALRTVWQSYHVDFDRVVLDGRDDALLHAVTNTRTLLAGLILRGLTLAEGQIADKRVRDSIENLASLPVYVVDQPDVAKALKQAGHQRVVEGTGGAPLLAWMRSVRREQPKSFQWQMLGPDQALAHWINVDRPAEGQPLRGLSVEVRGQTIDIHTKGIAELTLFLDDDLVNLDDIVQIRVNDKVAVDDLLPMPPKTRETTGRDLKALFERPPIDVRRYRYYGWLKGAQVTSIRVR